jgi:type I restriction enzyme M protein
MNELVKLIQSFAVKNGKDTKQVLSDLLQFIIGNFNPKPEPNPLWPYTKEQNAEFHAMMLAYISLMQDKLKTKEWYDAWGDIFMELTPRGGARGQFFTPADICELMADITLKNEEPQANTICGAFGTRVMVGDPTAGSARNLLASHARFLRNGWRKPYLVAEDLDIDCCRMSAINMMVHGCFGEVICHDTLADPKGLRFGYIINEGLYPIPGGLSTIRPSHDKRDFVTLR